MIGQTISHYKITAKLGEGGMGVVYKAEDTKLERTVALKFLAAHLLQDEEARKRFVREAKAAAALSHPNICTVHEIDEAEGRTFIAMAYVEGQSLDAKIAAGPLKLNEILDLARQIAEGLQEAHSHGIYHRDIKPQNILISTKSGSKQHATIMDFGLAHLTEQSKLTQKDTSLGTVAYMSPEQTMGAAIDQRTDIWALGCVIYEMVSGGQPFKGHYAQAVTYSILNEEPEPLTALRTGIPMELEWIVGKCLAKDAESRYQHASELAVDLKNLQDKLKSGRSTILRTNVAAGGSPLTSLAQPPQASATTVTPVPAEGVFLPKRKLRLLQGLVGSLALAALAFAFLYFREAPPKIPVTELTLDLPAGATLHTFSLSPDGQHVALALDQGQGGRSLWVRSMDSLEPREFAGTEGAQYPFWSPDSRQIGFFAQGKLKRVSVVGGPPQSLCDAEDGRGGTWSTAGVIVFSPSPFGQIHRVPEGGGEPVALTKANESGPQPARRFPSFLPDGEHFLYTVSVAGSDEIGVYMGSVDAAQPRRLLPDDSSAIYASGEDGKHGYVLFFRDGSLMAQPFDESQLAMSGDAFAVAEAVGQVANASNYGFSVSSGGSLLYVRGGAGLWDQSQLAWFDRTGKQLETLAKPLSLANFSLSPDGTRAALSVAQPPARPDIWIYEFARGTMLRFTNDPGSEITPKWSPDGGQIAFSSQRADGYHLYRKETSGAKDEQSLISSADNSLQGRIPRLNDWSPDGRFLLYHVQQPRTSMDLWILPLDGDRKPYAYLESAFLEVDGCFSPDGRWVAYASDESGRMEIYVRPFPAADRKWQISTQGGTLPAWSQDGRELYYIDPEVNLMAVPVKADSAIVAGSAQALFKMRLVERPIAAGTRLYDVSRDGRFLIANRVGDEQQNAERKLVMISDWRAKVGK